MLRQLSKENFSDLPNYSIIISCLSMKYANKSTSELLLMIIFVSRMLMLRHAIANASTLLGCRTFVKLLRTLIIVCRTRVTGLSELLNIVYHMLITSSFTVCNFDSVLR